MTDRLKDKIIVVTAAAQGIGRASAEIFVREGAKVIAVDINKKALEDVQGVTRVHLDLTDHKAVDEFAKSIGEIDGLFNCAGFVHGGTILEATDQEIDQAFDLNVKAAIRMIQNFLPGMLNRGGGSIVNMSSVAGSIIGVPNRFIYGVSKAAVIGLTKSVALDFVSKGIRCNAIAPGTVQSPSLDERLKATGNEAKARAEFVARQPMGRIATAEEVAELALFLISDASSYMTGTVNVVDGGWTVA